MWVWQEVCAWEFGVVVQVGAIASFAGQCDNLGLLHRRQKDFLSSHDRADHDYHDTLSNHGGLLSDNLGPHWLRQPHFQVQPQTRSFYKPPIPTFAQLLKQCFHAEDLVEI